ncbi:hypothetical protein EC844_12578 [Acinetobacter calcoaceticus]|uniref:DUF5626 domain-containing protein n=1 Tax=Acinetobacter calcoaceticus TaxID=471 RepID=A0A4R1XJR1_ACICA|nr:hypothetical protein EC844_12578 [Acinetobacter calcoaceticus]
MLKNSQNNNSIIIFLLLLISSNAAALGDKVSDGKVNVRLQNNHLCFSVSNYTPRPAIWGKQFVDSNNLKLSYIGVSSSKYGYIWGVNIPADQVGNGVTLSSKSCIEYGQNISGYSIQKTASSLKTGKYSVSIWGRDQEKNRAIVFVSAFALDVTNGQLRISKVD